MMSHKVYCYYFLNLNLVVAMNSLESLSHALPPSFSVHKMGTFLMPAHLYGVAVRLIIHVESPKCSDVLYKC